MCLRLCSICILLTLAVSSRAESPLLVRDGSIVTASTPRGDLPVKLTDAALPGDITAYVLSDTLHAEDTARIRRFFSMAHSHALQSINAPGVGDTLQSISTLAAAVPAGAGPGDWKRIIIIGRLPSPDSDPAWVAAWMVHTFGARRASVSFWPLDGAVPGWAQNVAAATGGSISSGDPATLDEPAAHFFEADWESKLPAGALPCLAEFKNERGERLASVQTMLAAAGFTPPLLAYLEARKKLQSAKDDDKLTAEMVIGFNPSDIDALRRLAKLYTNQHAQKEALAFLRRLTDLTPLDGDAWAEMSGQLLSAGQYAEAGQALAHADSLSVHSDAMLESRMRLMIHGNDFAGALPLIEQLLQTKKQDQSVWRLRADCANNLKRWPLEAESLEHAVALGSVPLERQTTLISGYLAAGQIEGARPHLSSATPALPRDGAIHAQYAVFWEQVHDAPAAEKLWRSAIVCNPKLASAHVGLAQHYFDNGLAAEASKAADDGLDMAPNSLPLILIKEKSLEKLGDIYAARRLLAERGPDSKQLDLLRRWAQLEDYYGADGARAYLALMDELIRNKGPQSEVTEVCRRGLLVAVRTEHLAEAKTFADWLAGNGDPGAAKVLQTSKGTAQSKTELLGGTEAFAFLVLGSAHAKPERILDDYSHVLASLAPSASAAGDKAPWQQFGLRIREYFRLLSTLAALGSHKPGKVELNLSLTNKADKQRTEKVFSILGLKLKNGKSGLTVASAEGQSQVKKQDTVAALAIDEQAIQEALAAGKSYTLEIPIDSVPVFPAVDLWQKAFGEHEKSPGGIFELFLTDQRLARVYAGLNAMDHAAADALTASVSLRTLAERYSVPLSLYSASMALNNKQAELPGGAKASGAWLQLAGVSPADPAAFFQALLGKDDGRLAAFFYTLSQLDFAHQKFFTRSPARTKRFYELFRDSPEMHHLGGVQGSGSFTAFLRELPLADDGSVDFPGDPEVWMVAKGSNVSGGSVAKLARKMKRTAAPDDEDEILIRLASTAYKLQDRQHSELANFIAVTRVEAERDHPLDRESALLLAQGYAQYQGLFPYFAELGDLEAADYQKAFSLETKLSSGDIIAANTALGELHSYLAILGLLREGAMADPKTILQLYRTGLDRYVNANDAGARTIASLKAIDDLVKLAPPKGASKDDALRSLLLDDLSANGTARQKTYQQVLSLQKVPSFDSLFAIWNALPNAAESAAALDDIQRQLAKLEVVPAPKTWKMTGDRKKHLDDFETASAANIVAKMREKLAKKKHNPAEMEKLSSQLLAELEPWVQLAMTGQIYARFLDPSDLVVSEDSMLLRKHEFVVLGIRQGKPNWFTSSNFEVSSSSEGSYFIGGLAEFSLVAGEARAAGNHLGGSQGGAFAAAMFASIRATDWRTLTPASLRTFGSTVRLAREWIVESASSPAMYRELEQDTLGLLSLARRKELLDAVANHTWPIAWQATSISDLHFLGDALLENTPAALWNSEILKSMKLAAAHNRELDALGSVAPELSGCAQPRLRRYEPYEDYQRHYSPAVLAQRISELKLYLAMISDDRAWQSNALPQLASKVADKLTAKQLMRDAWDWKGVLDSYRSLRAEDMEALLNQ